MSETAVEFLEQWRNSYICAAASSTAEVDIIVKQCLDDAAASGVLAEDVTKAAGGDLRGYILAALKKTSGE